ncbi:MAG: hypothetical protein KGY75_00990 [Candidatus Cloacimonetes bacterium]|nr:hypothetical protein [Candidatus Cloacimonadota bacterium]MBS3766692.1 hypothetical protein [Candidatus Cloacimonadota bacterium]
MSYFFGFIIILFGFSIIINAVFNIHIPLFKIIFALFLIYLGAKILFGAFNIKTTDHSAVFGKGRFSPTSPKSNYSIVFGEGEIDLTDIDLAENDLQVDINTVFGECRVKIDKNTPVVIKANTILGAARLPGKNVTALGKSEYKTKNFSPIKNKLIIRVDVIFGEFRTEFIEVIKQSSDEESI